MKKVTYYCELCKEATEPNNLLAIVWSSTVQINNKFGGYILDSDLSKSDKHICTNCNFLIKES